MVFSPLQEPRKSGRLAAERPRLAPGDGMRNFQSKPVVCRDVDCFLYSHRVMTTHIAGSREEGKVRKEQGVSKNFV
jgi:hypothetical protein